MYGFFFKETNHEWSVMFWYAEELAISKLIEDCYDYIFQQGEMHSLAFICSYSVKCSLTAGLPAVDLMIGALQLAF